MTFNRLTIARLVAVFAMIVLLPQPAYAYLDPGIGSLLFQSAIAGFVAIAGAWAALKLKIADLFGRNRSTPEEQSQRDDPS